MFKGGVKEAAKMLQALGPQQAQKLLDQIRKQDPNMAAELEKNLISMEDLQYLTPSMLVTLLRDIDLEVFGLALRIIDPLVTEKILEGLSTGIILDIEDGLKGKPRAMTEVQKAQDEVLKLLKHKVESGQVVIDPEGDKLV